MPSTERVAAPPRKNGTSAPSASADRRSRSSGQSSPQRRFSASRVEAASELPPPRPAPAGHALVDRDVARRARCPLAACSARAARRHRSSAGSGAPRSWRRQPAVVAALDVQRVAPVDQHEHRLQQVIAVGAPADDMQEQVELGRRRRRRRARARPSRSARRSRPDAHASATGAAAVARCAASRSVVEARQVDRQPSCSKPALAGARAARRAGPRPAAQPVEQAATGTLSPSASRVSASRSAKRRARPWRASSTTSAATSAPAPAMRAERRRQVERAGARIAAQLEAAQTERAAAGCRRPRRRTERRPATVSPDDRRVVQSCGDRGAAGAARAARRPRAEAGPAAARAVHSSTRRRASVSLQHVVARVARAALAPDLARLLGLARRPQHLAEVGGDLRIGTRTGRPHAAGAAPPRDCPRRYSTQPRLSVMNGSPGLSSSAFWISSRASGSRILRSASE